MGDAAGEQRRDRKKTCPFEAAVQDVCDNAITVMQNKCLQMIGEIKEKIKDQQDQADKCHQCVRKEHARRMQIITGTNSLPDVSECQAIVVSETDEHIQQTEEDNSGIDKLLSGLEQLLNQGAIKMKQSAEEYRKMFSDCREQFIAEKKNSRAQLLKQYESHRAQLATVIQRLQQIKYSVDQPNESMQRIIIQKLDELLTDLGRLEDMHVRQAEQLQQVEHLRSEKLRELKVRVEQLSSTLNEREKQLDEKNERNQVLCEEIADLNIKLNEANSKLKLAGITQTRELEQRQKGIHYSEVAVGEVAKKTSVIEKSSLPGVRGNIQISYSKLIDMLQPRRVAIKMFQDYALTIPEFEYIHHSRTPSEAADHLLQVLLSVSDERVHSCFLLAIENTGQLDIVRLLEEPGYEPNEEHVHNIRKHFSDLVDKMDLYNYVIAKFYSKDVIDNDERNELSAELNSSLRNTRFLNMLIRKPASKFLKFKWLMKTEEIGQGHVIKSLEERTDCNAESQETERNRTPVQAVQHVVSKMNELEVLDKELYQPKVFTYELSSFISENMQILVRIVLFRSDLIDSLSKLDVLTPDQVKRILENHTTEGRVRQLLEEIGRKSISGEVQEHLLMALDQTGNKHVSNFIRGNGRYAAEYGYDWPLACFSAESTKMDEVRWELIELIDTGNGLLDMMLACGCINYELKHKIETYKDRCNQTIALLGIVQVGSLATYNIFVRCLLQTEQLKVVSLLAHHLVEDKLLLSAEQQSRIQRNYSTLVHLIDSRNGLSSEMHAVDYITEPQKKYIESAATPTESNKRLIDIIRRSETDLHKLINCLYKTNQRHISRILLDRGAVARIVANIKPLSSRDLHERQIVEKLNALLKDSGWYSNETMQTLRENEVSILATCQTQNGGIDLFFFCESLWGLQYLHRAYSSWKLKFLMAKIFISLFDADEARDLYVDSLQWDFSNYTDCVQQLCTYMKLPILSRVYEMAKENQELVSSSCDDIRSIPIDQLPFELVEIIVMRTAGLVFSTINRSMPLAERYSYATISAVSRLWWTTLEYRKYNRRCLKRYFERVCQPFKCSPYQMTTIPIEGGNNVTGVAEFGGELYVVCEWSDIIQVFNSIPPFSRLYNLTVPGMKNASDIIVCDEADVLYIADRKQCAIFRVNLIHRKEEIGTFLSFEWKPSTLSINARRLLITPRSGDSLYIYNHEGIALHHIELPHEWMVHHAVQAAMLCIVSHHHRRSTQSEWRSVSVVHITGHVIRTFDNNNDSIIFNMPRYLVVANNHVLVADCFNGRITLLKSDFQSKRVLINSMPGKEPWRLCLASSGLLMVSYVRSNDIDVFCVKKANSTKMPPD